MSPTTILSFTAGVGHCAGSGARPSNCCGANLTTLLLLSYADKVSVRSSVTLGVASSVANDVKMRMTS